MKLPKNVSKHAFLLIPLTFVFVATSALAISKENSLLTVFRRPAKIISFPSPVKEYVSIPIQINENPSLDYSAVSVLAVDAESGVTLFEKNPDIKLLPASTTKIITALVTLDYYPPNAVLQVSDILVDGQKMDLVPGEKISVDSLLKGLLIISANDAAEVLAQNYPGGTKGFVLAMNEKAKRINLENTFFTNPSGLDTEGHLSTARDLVRAATYAMKNPYFSEIVATKQTIVASVDNQIIHPLTNINQLIGEIDGVLGVKTGWTEFANENLVTYVERDGRKVVISLLGSQDRFGETENLINWIYGNYLWSRVSYP